MSITARKAGRFIRAACPPWLAFLWLVCACVPTPFEVDNALPAALTVVLLAVDWRRIPRGCSAWRGGKTHRAGSGRRAS